MNLKELAEVERKHELRDAPKWIQIKNERKQNR